MIDTGENPRSPALLYSALCSREGRGAVAFPDELEPTLEDEM